MPPSTFHPFPRLPAELRFEIWRLASTPSPRSEQLLTDRAICILPNGPFTQTLDEGTPAGTVHPRLVFKSGNPGMLSTSHEARGIALKTATTRPYDPKSDILYVPASRFNSRHIDLCTMARGYHDDTWDWLHEVRHIGFAPPGRRVLYNFGQGIPKLAALQTVSIVYLTPPGVPLTINATERREGADKLPYWHGASARLVDSFKTRDTPKRRENAGNLVSQWHVEQKRAEQFAGRYRWFGAEVGLEESCWFWPEIDPTEDANERKRSVRRQLEDLEYAVNRDFRSGPYWRAGCWSREKNWLTLRYETRCLAP